VRELETVYIEVAMSALLRHGDQTEIQSKIGMLKFVKFGYFKPQPL